MQLAVAATIEEINRKPYQEIRDQVHENFPLGRDQQTAAQNTQNRGNLWIRNFKWTLQTWFFAAQMQHGEADDAKGQQRAKIHQIAQRIQRHSARCDTRDAAHKDRVDPWGLEFGVYFAE